MTGELDSRGFVLKDLVKCADPLEMVGLLFRGDLLCWQHRPRRFWLLRRGLQEILRQKRASGDVVRVLCGHRVAHRRRCRGHNVHR